MPPHAPCRLQRGKEKCNEISASLPPHAPCRLQLDFEDKFSTDNSLPPHAPCRLQHEFTDVKCLKARFASTRSVQIATAIQKDKAFCINLCLHTLRADCNGNMGMYYEINELCLHTLRADCNGAGTTTAIDNLLLCLHTLRADCNVVNLNDRISRALCLHTLRADCNGVCDAGRT